MAHEEEGDTAHPVGDTPAHPEHNNPAPETTPPPVDPPAGNDALSELAKRVDEHEALLTGLLRTGDSTPARKPWTHRKMFGKG